MMKQPIGSAASILFWKKNGPARFAACPADGYRLLGAADNSPAGGRDPSQGRVVSAPGTPAITA